MRVLACGRSLGEDQGQHMTKRTDKVGRSGSEIPLARVAGLGIDGPATHLTGRGAPGSCIDYVVTHELCHLVHGNHEKEFFALLRTTMLDWESRKARLEQVMAK